jgi:hypothetical protein
VILYLKDNLVLEITKLWVLRVPPIQIPTQNGKMKMLLSEFHPRTNLTALLSSSFTVEKNWDFLTSFSLSNKSTYLAYKISYRKISEINVKAVKMKILRLSFPLLWKTPYDICIVKELWSKSHFCWEMRNGIRTFLDTLRLWRSLRFYFSMKFSFSGHWAFHFCSMWMRTTAFYSPKVHFHGGNADIFPLCWCAGKNKILRILKFWFLRVPPL